MPPRSDDWAKYLSRTSNFSKHLDTFLILQNAIQPPKTAMDVIMGRGTFSESVNRMKKYSAISNRIFEKHFKTLSVLNPISVDIH